MRNVEKHFLLTHTLCGTDWVILERNPTNVRSVENHIATLHYLRNIKEFILKTPTSVKYVGRSFVLAQDVLNTREFTLERNPTSVKNVERAFLLIPTLLCTNYSILERNLTNGKNVVRYFILAEDLLNTSIFTLERNTTNGMDMSKLFTSDFTQHQENSYGRETIPVLIFKPLLNTRGFLLYRNPIDVKNVAECFTKL